MLKLFPWLIALALFSSFEANAQLTTIDYAERYADKAVNTSDYRASWNDQTTPITTRSLSDFYDSRLTNGSGHGSTGFSHLTVNFDVSSQYASNSWGFRLAPDAGYGGAIYLDGTQIASATHDLWWDYNYNNTANFLIKAGLSVSAGSHVFEGYWAEGCCNGGQAGLFSTDGSKWLNLSVANLEDPSLPGISLQPVPEPEEWLMMLVGFALVGAQVKRKQSAGKLEG